MFKLFAAMKDILITTAATASLISLVNQAPIDPLLKGFLLGFITATIASILLALSLLQGKKKRRKR